MKLRLVCALLLPLACAVSLTAQSSPAGLAARMDPALQTPEEVALRLRQYILPRIPTLPPAVSSAAAWQTEAARLRGHIFETLFRGWPKDWIDAQGFEDAGSAGSGPGYRLRRLKLQIVPGMWESAIVYEPDPLPRTPVPAILNVNGHVGPPGKSVEYKQKRCIQQARMGIVAVNLEWFGYGDLLSPGNSHWNGAHLDLVGANGTALFYLALKRGIDYLATRGDIDQKRLGVTGLSGGGWQTIFLSALDERVAVAVPVAGFMSLASRIQKFGEPGDFEQNPTDILGIADYAHFVALRSPRPTLLVHNAEDNCCFRAPLVKQRIFDDVLPFFFGRAAQNLAWHENLDPADHNYQLDNRMQAYHFFARHFGVPDIREEGPVGAELRTVQELAVPLPPDNLTILGLAKRLAASAVLSSPAASRADLAGTVRYRQVDVVHAWPLANTKHKEIETISYLFEFSNGLTATAFWAKAIPAPAEAPVSLVLHDKSRKDARDEISRRVDRSEQVFAVDLLFHGDSSAGRDWTFAEFLSAVGERPLGIEAAQLLAIRRWIGKPVRLSADGFRSQLVAHVAAALAPAGFRDIEVRNGIRSLEYLLNAPVDYHDAPEVFCLGLYPRFDLDALGALARPVPIKLM